MAEVFCFVSAKGGSGKTIVSATMGTALAALGKRVLLVDADSSTNGMTLLYLKSVVSRDSGESESERSVGIFSEELQSPGVVELQPNLHLVPAVFEMKATHTVAAQVFEQRLGELLRKHRDAFDYILIDAQAGVEEFAIIAAKKADHAVITSEYDPISAKGIGRVEAMMSLGDRSSVLFNKVLPEFVGSIGDPLGVSKYLPAIPWSPEVVRAYVKGGLALDMEKGNVFTIGLLNTASALFGQEIERLVEQWRASKDEFIRAPIKKQLGEVNEELEFVQKKKVEAEFRASSPSILTPGVRAALMVTSVAATMLFGWTYVSESQINAREVFLRSLDVPPVDYDVQLFEIQAAHFLIINFRVGAGLVLASLLLGFALFYQFRRVRWDSKKLELLQQAAALEERMKQLREERAQLEAHDRSSLDQLLQNSRIA